MKKLRIWAFVILAFILMNGVIFAENEGDVYVIPIKGDITRASYNFLRDSLDKVVNNSTKAIIFEIDTYGGLISEAEKIKNLIIGLEVPTITFVNNKAESAGVLISIAGEKLVMAESSTIGSAETSPDTEKVLSMWRSFLRDVAQLRGRNPQIVEAMADKDIHIEGLSERGKLLNLTSREALEYGICDLISNDYDEILSHFNISYTSIVEVEESLELKAAKFLSGSFISTLLLTLGFVGLVVELFTPGFGIGGTISIISFGLFFAGNILAGNSQWTSLAVFVTGLILLVIEAIIPGFGLPGISGIILVVLGAILAMGSVTQALMSVSVAIIITTLITLLLIKRGSKSPIFDKIILDIQHKEEEGYVSAKPKDEYLGKEGIAVTELRPSGIIEIDGRRLDALSSGNFIQKNTRVKVIKVEGSKIIVRRI